MNHDDLPFSPAAERNAAPILAVLSAVLPAQASVLEIASGTGQHAAHFAAARPLWRWQPTDLSAQALPAIDARCAGLANVAPAGRLDVLAQPWPWPAAQFDALYGANLLHISPWASCAALMQGAARHLVPGGSLAVYGPFVVDGVVTAPSNLAFDADLRSRDPQWGLRTLSAVVAEAAAVGIEWVQRVEMPANNLMLVFRRLPQPHSR